MLAVLTGENYGQRIIYSRNVDDERRRYVLNSCNVCEQIFMPRLDNVKKGCGDACSRSCAGTLGARKRNEKYGLSQENNPNWRGGISEDDYRYKKRMQEKYPRKVAARRMVHEAVRTGSLEKQPCEECGSTENVEAHHPDYSNPLDVVWLCREHHRQLHSN